MNELEGLKVIAKGKTKTLYEIDNETNYMVFGDDITTNDGDQHDIIEGKAELDFETNRNIFNFLRRKGIPVAYLSDNGKFSKVLNLNMFPLEVVSRRIGTGSLLKRSHFVEGTYFDPLTMEFFLKDDEKHDPLMNYSLLTTMGYALKNLRNMEDINKRVFLLLENAFREHGDVQLIDFKLEYGIGPHGGLYLGDEVTSGSMRVWPLRKNVVYPTSNHTPEQIMNEVLDKSRQLDKQIYRDGGSDEEVMTGFEKIKDITSRF